MRACAGAVHTSGGEARLWLATRPYPGGEARLWLATRPYPGGSKSEGLSPPPLMSFIKPCGVVWCCVWCGMVLCAVWHGVVCGVVWCCVWCGMVSCCDILCVQAGSGEFEGGAGMI